MKRESSRKNAANRPQESSAEEPSEQEGQPAGLFDGQPMQVVSVYRVDDSSKKFVYHGRLMIEEATEARVAELFGGGKYRLQLLNANDMGRQVIEKVRFFELPGAYRPPTTLPGASRESGVISSSVARPVVPGDAGSMSSGEALNMAIVSQVIDMMKSMREQPQQQARDWTPVISAGLTALTTILTTILTRPRDEGSTEMVRTLMDKITNLTEQVAKGAQSPTANAFDDILKTMERLSDMGELFGNRQGKPVDAEGRMLEMVPKLIDAMTSNKNGAAAAPEAGAVARTDIPVWQQMMLAQRGHMVRSAMLGIDPAFAADITEAYLPDHMRGALLELLSRPDCAEVIAQVIPEMRSYGDWSGRFVTALRTVFAPEEVEELGGEEVPAA